MADENVDAAKAEFERLEEMKRAGPRRRLDTGDMSKYLPYALMAVIAVGLAAAFMFARTANPEPVANYTCAPAVSCAPSLECPSMNTSLSCPAVNVSCGQTDMVCSPSMVMYGSNSTGS